MTQHQRANGRFDVRVQSHDGADHSDPRILRTQAGLQQALLELLSEGTGLSTLTISAISERAGVTRRTFYAHYRDPEDIVCHISAQLFDDISESIPDDFLSLPLTGGRFGFELFGRLLARADVLHPLLSSCEVKVFHEPMKNALATLIYRICDCNQVQRLSDEHLHYLIEVTGGAGLGMLSAWARRGFTDSPDAMAIIFGTLIFPGLDRYLQTGQISI